MCLGARAHASLRYPPRVSEPPALLLSLFQHAWGASLSELTKPSPGALVLPGGTADELAAALAEAGLHEDAVFAALQRWLWSRNQFLELSEDSQAELAESVERALHQLQAQADVASTLASHRDELAAFVQAHLGKSPREVVCAEYTPELQLQILGLGSVALAEPVLDIGCGESAGLVRFLRARGVRAQGLDRAVRGELGFTADWLSFPYEAHRPGTALSHQGFSLHFLHHHLKPGDGAFAYARAYMAILRALLPGGRFVYTPGLPFLEDMLDADLYRVQRVTFASELRVASLRQIEAATGLSLSYATHVERVR